MEEPVDDLVYSKRLKKPKGKITLFKENAHYIRLPSPYANSSLDTAKEILTVQGATYIKGEAMIRSIKKHDKDPSFALKTYMSLFGLKFDVKFIKKVTEEATALILEHKNKFNRPRPEQLAPYFGVDLNVLDSVHSKTSSYPSGHSTQARLVAEIYAEKYPEHKLNLLRAAEECGGGRIMAGLQYPSDHRAGIHLAKRLFKMLKGRKKKVYNKIIDIVLK